MDLGIAGKVALVTGAGRGIGRAIATALAREGARVALVSRTQAELDEVAAEIVAAGGAAVAFACDVSTREHIAGLAPRVELALGAPLIVVNNAATHVAHGRIDKLEDAAFDAALHANLTMLHGVTKAFLPSMRKARWGRVINVGSLAGELGGHGQIAYATIKAAMVGFTRTIAIEGGPHGITANMVIPGAIETERLQQSLSEQARRLLHERPMIPRTGRPEEIAAAVAYLASIHAGYTTGTELHVSGGYELNLSAAALQGAARPTDG